jgi:hypothetical protein
VANAPFTYRPRSGPAAAVGAWVIAGLAAASLVTDQSAQSLRWAPALAWFALSAWAVFWAPSVAVGEAGLNVRNVAASHYVPWAAISRIDTKWALTLHTGQGKVTAFAAPAPSSLQPLRRAGARDIGHLPESTFDAGGSVRPGDLPGTASGDLAWVVRERWQEVRDAGPTGPASGQRPTRRWHIRLLAAWALLGCLTALALAVG